VYLLTIDGLNGKFLFCHFDYCLPSFITRRQVELVWPKSKRKVLVEVALAAEVYVGQHIKLVCVLETRVEILNVIPAMSTWNING
jgi:hypothetical protein